MKIAAILPGDASSLHALESFNSRVSPGTEVTLFCATGGVFETSGDVDLKGPEAAILAMQAERDGYDAVVICGACDFGLSLVRGAVNIPVVGTAMATYLFVYQIARRFGVVSINRDWNPAFERALRDSGCEGRMTSMRAMPKPFKLTQDGTEWPYSKRDWEAEILKIAAYQVQEEGAQCIVPACALMFAMLEDGAQQRLTATLGVIVVDPQAIALRTAEMFVNLQMSHSKIEYPPINPVSFENRFQSAAQPQLRRTA